MREALNTSATIAGTCTFIAQVSGTSPVAPNLRPAMNTTLAALGRRSSASRSSRSQAIVSTPRLLERLAQARLAEPRHADHALLGRGALGHARQRRAHLAADAEDQDVAVERLQLRDQLGRRGRHEILERGDALEARGQGHVVTPDPPRSSVVPRSRGIEAKRRDSMRLSPAHGPSATLRSAGDDGGWLIRDSLRCPRHHRAEVHLRPDREARHVQRAERDLAARVP